MKLAIVGTGTMGRIVRDMALQNPGIDQVYSIEPALGESLSDIPQPDVVIDFSHPDALASARKTRIRSGVFRKKFR